MIPVYPTLAGEMAKRGYNKKDVAKGGGMSQRTFYSRLSGKTPFTLPEATAIHREFFPDIDMDTLFSQADEQKGA